MTIRTKNQDELRLEGALQRLQQAAEAEDLRRLEQEPEVLALQRLEQEPWPTDLPALDPQLAAALRRQLPSAPRRGLWELLWRWLHAPLVLSLAPVVALLLVIAGGAALYRSGPQARLAAYEVKVSADQRTLGGSVVPRDAPTQVYQDARLRVVLRPMEPVAAEPVKAQLWLREGTEWIYLEDAPLLTDARAVGVLALDKRVAELPRLTAGSHDLAFVVGWSSRFPRPEQVRGQLRRPGAYVTRDWCILRHSVVVKGAEADPPRD